MQDELNQFERSQVWNLVPRPNDRSIIDTKWVFRNKLNEDGTVTRNKARLVVQGYIQDEATTTKLDVDEPGSSVDQKLYREMIGSLLYLTASRPDIIFSVCLCARFQWDMLMLIMQGFLMDIKSTSGCILIFCDNTSAISMIKNPVYHKRTKHIDVRHHFLRDNYEKGLITAEFCAIDKQIDDISTKALSIYHFERNMLELGMIKIT
ncbi:uncharacterized protein [Nicotiana tomentosiformis]|uniref:uncharacterized protein n=1 Tax=Nicotiana tomentosiformis TaxID=4098 RepID=UPI00388C5493